MALLLFDNGCDVTVWSAFPEHVRRITEQRENVAFLPGVSLPGEIAWTTDREIAADKADVVVLAAPTKFSRSVVAVFSGILPPSCLILSVAKGLDSLTHERMSQVAESILNRKPVAALSGPSHAEEVARKIPTAVTVAAEDQEVCRALQRIFTNRYFRVYTSGDITGVELGGALKNIIAIAVGVSDGIGFGDNTRAALMTRGLAEITRMGCRLGAKEATFAGLSGMGDLIVTCTSRFSRNRAVGERIGKGESIADILASSKQVAEGVGNCAIARDIAREFSVDAPITEEVCAIIHEGKSPHEAVTSLLARDVKPEQFFSVL